MTLTEFRVQYPEFRTVGDEFLQCHLDQAERLVSSTVCCNKFDLLHGLKTADLIARSPGGVAAKLLAKDGTTTYGNAFDKAKYSVGTAGIMTG